MIIKGGRGEMQDDNNEHPLYTGAKHPVSNLESWFADIKKSSSLVNLIIFFHLLMPLMCCLCVNSFIFLVSPKLQRHRAMARIIAKTL